MAQVIAAFKQINGVRTDLITGEVSKSSVYKKGITEISVQFAEESAPKIDPVDVPSFMRKNRRQAEPGEVFYTHHDLDIPSFMRKS